MTRVLQVLGHSAGGIARHVAHVTEALRDDDLVIEIAGPADLPLPMPDPLHRVEIPDGPLRGHRSAIAGLRRVIGSGRFDVVHAHGLRAGIDAGRARRATGARLLLTVHNLVHPGIAGRARAPVYALAERLAVREADHVFAVSEDIAGHLRSRGPEDTAVEVLHLGVDPPPPARRSPKEIRAALGVEPGTPLIVTAARLAPQKALPVMFEAVGRLRSPVLAVLGMGPLFDALQDVANDVAGDRVRFLGFRDDLADHLRAADVFCLSSLWEGVPLAAMEAIQVGTPVVATDVGGMRELIADRRSGRLVPPHDPAALAEALREVLEAPDVGRAYATAARHDLEVNFSGAAMLSRLRTVYGDARHG